jgi:DNA-directed RNA polymerase specialized sigma24 family protein
MTTEEFQALLQRVRDGCPQAAHDLVLAYDAQLRYRVRKRLGQPLRRIVDSTDVVQAAWMRFFEGLDHARRIDDPKQLMAFLSKIADNLLCNL